MIHETPNPAEFSSEIEKLAAEAIEYANFIVLKCATSLSLNSADATERNKIYNALARVRKTWLSQDPYRLLNKNYYYYKSSLANIFKYSFGNCHEMALISFHYVVENEQKKIFLREKNTPINAELFYILNGDHVFVVLNRDPKSQIDQPSTWGNAAYVCDPWSKIYFRASDYLAKLQNYIRIETADSYRNTCNSFDVTKHSLAKCADTVTPAYILNPVHLSKLKKRGERKIKSLLKACDTYEQRLIEMMNGHLIGKNKNKIIEQKIKQVIAFKCTLLAQQMKIGVYNCVDDLYKDLTRIFKQSNQKLAFTTDEKHELYYGNKLKKFCMGFFSVRSATEMSIKMARKELKTNLYSNFSL